MEKKQQPNLPTSNHPEKSHIIQKSKKSSTVNQRQILQFILWAAAFGIVMFISLGTGAFAGYQSGTQSQRLTATTLAKSNVDEQFVLASKDIVEGRLELAHRRLEFVINQDPAYPGATEKLAEVMAILYATATPTKQPPTATPTATRDLRPVEDMLLHAQSLVSETKWGDAIDTLIALRKEDLAYRTARVDGLMFIALRMRGFDKIWKQGDLNGGIYDLVLASKFGPLDAQANSARELARLYLIGSSFWDVDPAQAIIYFSQVAAAAPGLIDASGWTAAARYREVLIQYGDKLAANKEWCNAQTQYELALSMGADASLQEKTQNAALQCSPPTATPSPTGELPSETPGSPTVPSVVTAIPTTVVPSSPTNTIPSGPPTSTTSPPTNTTVPPSNTPVTPEPAETTPPAVGQSPQAPYP